MLNCRSGTLIETSAKSGQQVHQECSTCFSTILFPGTIIDENGQCSRCRSCPREDKEKPRTAEGITALRALVSVRKKENAGKYDCIIGASGGFDSSHIIYVAKKILDLNPLVVKYDHGFNHDIADRNLRTICRNLNLDLKIVKSKHQDDYKYVRSIVLAFRDVGLYWGICKFCRYAVGAVALREALKNRTPLILEAVNTFEKDDSLSSRVKAKMFWSCLVHIHPLKWPRVLYYVLIACYHLLKMKLELFVPPLWNLGRTCPRLKSVKKLYLSDYINWDINTISGSLVKEMGWSSPHPTMPMRFDCQFEDSFCNYTSRKVTGLTNHAIICNKLIYANIRTKDELRTVVEEYDRVLGQRMKDMMLRLNID